MTPDPELDHDFLIQYLVESIRCNDCGALYDEQDVQIVAHDSHAWTLAVFCPVCGAESVIMAYLDEADMIDPDLAPPDDGEVRAWGRFLALFRGDLRDLLRY